MHERGQLAVHAPLHDTVVRLVGKEDISLLSQAGPSVKAKSPASFWGVAPGSDDLALCRQRLRSAEQAQAEPDKVIHVSLDAGSEIQLLSGVKKESRPWPSRGKASNKVAQIFNCHPSRGSVTHKLECKEILLIIRQKYKRTAPPPQVPGQPRQRSPPGSTAQPGPGHEWRLVKA